MITGDQIGQTIRYWKDGWHTGLLVALDKQKSKFLAIIKTPIAGQRKKRVPAEDCEVYTENELKGKL